jgi:hypothetical protein
LPLWTGNPLRRLQDNTARAEREGGPAQDTELRYLQLAWKSGQVFANDTGLA